MPRKQISPAVLERRAPVRLTTTQSSQVAEFSMADAEELADRINTPAGDDPLLSFDASMSKDQIGQQLRALRDKARREQIR
jgi:hypothetical protein